MAVLAASAGQAAAPVGEQDRRWLVAAHQSNLAEIAAGTSAVARATSPDVREIGQMMIDMHNDLDDDVVATAADLGVVLPDAPTRGQEAVLAAVERQTGQRYDAAWIDSRIAGHEVTLAATEAEINAGTNPQVVRLANAARPVIQQHLTDLQEFATPPALAQTR
jgi:putative membrane protein